MGIYDRDYYREGGSGFRLRLPRTAVVAIILINAAVYVAEVFESAEGRQGGFIVRTLECHVNPLNHNDDTLTRPWMWWQFLTCGFLHDPNSVWHIFGNLLTLFFLGRDVEEWYGTREFVRLYLVALVFSSISWAVCARMFYPGVPSNMYGASGAVTAVVLLFALLFPKRTLLFMFVLPLPAWLLGAMIVGYDIYGATFRPEDHVAYTAHIGGAAFALAYFYLHWNLGNIIEPVVAWIKGHSRPSLKVFKPDDDDRGPVTEEEVDRILTKIHREGEGSLTSKERRIMESASREYRRRRRRSEP